MAGDGAASAGSVAMALPATRAGVAGVAPTGTALVGAAIAAGSVAAGNAGSPSGTSTT
jgi:hypothetical protein